MGVRPGLKSQLILFRKELEDEPLFRITYEQLNQYLTSEHCRQRRQYDQQYGHNGPEFWANCWFVDECSIEIGVGRARQWTWRHGGEAWMPKHMAFRALNKQNCVVLRERLL